MEVIVSAVLGDIISRSISFLVDRYHRLQAGGAEESLQRLRRLLLRVQATVEEAERRQITNQAMLRQLEMLGNDMYRGYYMLDALTCRRRGEGDATAKDEVSDRSLITLCRVSPVKRLCLSARAPKNTVFDGNELSKVLCRLETIVVEIKEFVVFLKCYRLLCRRPCSSYLSTDMCMFGRHTEYERIVSFLLQVGPPGTANFSLLPVVGPARVGKSTLVEHVCYDDRVRGYFSSIVFLSGDDLQLQGAEANALQDSGVIKYRNGASHGRLLVVMELIGDLEKEIWTRLWFLLSHMAHGSKVVVTSRSERIMRLGTTQALRLNALPHEAYWYFFKMIAFRDAGPDDYSELSSIAMEIAAELNASFINANIIGTLLRANLDVRFWRKALERIREFTAKHVLMFGEHPVDLMRKGRPVYLWRMTGGGSEVLVANGVHQVCSPHQEVPKLTLLDVVSGSAMPRGNCKFLAWKSQIPPYYSYLVSCSTMTSRQMVVNKKRSRLQSV